MGEIKTNWKLSDLKQVSEDVEYYSNDDKKQLHKACEFLDGL